MSETLKKTPEELRAEYVERALEELANVVKEGRPSAKFIEYGIDEEGFREVLTRDLTAGDDTFPETHAYLERHLRHPTSVETGPFVAAAGEKDRRRVRRDLARDQREHEEEEALRANVRHYGPRVLGVLAALGTAYGVTTTYWPDVVRYMNSEAAQDVLAAELAGRNLSTHAANGQTLDGATIRFFCRPKSIYTAETESIVDQWVPREVSDEYDDSNLEGPYFEVNFEAGKEPEISIAEAGWGTTVQLTKEQADSGLGKVLRRQEVEVEGNGTWTVFPTMAFVRDADFIAGYVATTGAMAQDGGLLTYYLYDTTKGELACKMNTDLTNLSPEELVGHMETATLLTELPVHYLLEYTNNERPTVAENYIASFEEYGLDGWYQVYFPSLVDYIDVAIQDGSKRGISRAEQQLLADYVKDHVFEADLLRTLSFLKSKLRSDVFARLITDMKNVNSAPVINLTETAKLIHDAAAGEESPISAEGGVLLRTGMIGYDVITHELFHQLLQGNPHKNRTFFSGCVSEEVNFDDGDELFFEGFNAYLEMIGRGKTAEIEAEDFSAHGYHGRLALISYLVRNADMNEIVNFYTLHPNLKMTDAQKALLTEIGVPFPASSSTEQMYVILFRQLGLDAMSSESEKEKAKAVFATLNDFSLDGQEIKPSDRQKQEEKALTILAYLQD